MPDIGKLLWPRSVAVEGIGVKVNCFCAVKGVALESVTVMLKVKLGGVVGEEVGAPVISPEGLRVIPVGRERFVRLPSHGINSESLG